MSQTLQFKVLPLVQPIDSNYVIEIDKIKSICSCGLSTCPVEDRCVAWLALLNVYPLNPIKWKEKQELILDEYNKMKEEFQLLDYHNRVIPQESRQSNYSWMDKESAKAMTLVHSDVVRTLRHIQFLPCVEEPPPEAPDDFIGMCCRNMRRIERILFLFGVKQKELGYLQGFNELVLPLYFANINSRQVFNDDMDLVEAITFNCFENLVMETEIHEFYQTKDNLEGVQKKMDEFSELVRRFLPDIHQILETMGISPLQYAFKWFNLLFAQDYQLPDVLIIWDGLLAHIDDLMNFVYCVAIVHMKQMRGRLQKADFAAALMILQAPKSSNLELTLKEANEIYKQFKEPGMFDTIGLAIRGFRQSWMRKRT